MVIMMVIVMVIMVLRMILMVMMMVMVIMKKFCQKLRHFYGALRLHISHLKPY